MKPRELSTIHNLIASNYTITPLAPGRYRHSFTPANTQTVYEFEANITPVIEEGERYNIGYSTDDAGRNLVDISSLSKTSMVDPALTYTAAQQLARAKYDEERAKNDQRVRHNATDDYYWGKKYAWRTFGMAVSRNAFDDYLLEIGHPSVPCTTQDPDRPFANDQSIAYKETGLKDAVENLIKTSKQVTPAYYKSPLYSKKFAIKGLNAITDKK